MSCCLSCVRGVLQHHCLCTSPRCLMSQNDFKTCSPSLAFQRYSGFLNPVGLFKPQSSILNEYQANQYLQIQRSRSPISLLSALYASVMLQSADSPSRLSSDNMLSRLSLSSLTSSEKWREVEKHQPSTFSPIVSQQLAE